ncbi:MAG: DUF4919 domain-containing protein [Lacunisphaera sp.]|nr:DUF4919 domain-containing protein [Lacunisphaera sp.]
MKTRLRLLLLISMLLAGPLLAQNSPWPAEREARANMATEQRLAYAATAEYNPYHTKIRDIRKAAFDFLEKGQSPEAIAEAQQGLALSKYNIDLLIFLATAYRASGDLANADKVRQQWMGLVDSILHSGNGRDYASAFLVINVDEEYSVLRVLQLEVTNQSLVEHNGSEFDVMKVKDTESGAEGVLYFNVDLPKKWLNKKLSLPAK